MMLLLVLVAVSCAGPEGGPRTEAREPADMILLGGTLVTMDAAGSVIDNGGVAVVDGAFAAVGTADEIGAAWTADRIVRLDPRDIVFPGLVNGHGHAAMTLLRGVADDMQLMDWLQNYIFPAEAEAVTEEFVRVGTTLAAMEMIRSGTTTFVDMYYFEQVAAEVVDEVGLRGVLGETVIGFPVPDAATPADALAYTRQFMERWKDHPRVTATVAPHAAYTVDPDVLGQVAALAREFDRPILIHLAETADEVAQIQERYGVTPTRHLHNLGLLGPDVVAAHAVWLTDEDIGLLAETGAGVVHNPESNMKLASGTMRVPDLLAAGVAVGAGTDGAASNNDLDMFGAMLVAALLQKHATGDPTALGAAAVLEMATMGGARVLGMADSIGSIETGKRADLAVASGQSAAMTPRYDAVSHLVYVARGADVRITMVEGHILYEDGVFTTLDPERTLANARTIAAEVRGIVGLAR
jgi:5-methylthioadenosine/S-adenosylhomocysteine deaminase